MDEVAFLKKLYLNLVVVECTCCSGQLMNNVNVIADRLPNIRWISNMYKHAFMHTSRYKVSFLPHAGLRTENFG